MNLMLILLTSLTLFKIKKISFFFFLFNEAFSYKDKQYPENDLIHVTG